jgi:hypothetical protein
VRPLILHTPFAPPEWVRAHGFRPVRPPAVVAACGTCAGLCATAAAAQAGSGPAVFATTCDQLRRAIDGATQGFLLDVPAAWQAPAAQRLWRDELRRLGRWMVSLGGTAPDAAQLATEVRTADAERRARRDQTLARDGHPRLAVIGGPLPAIIPELIAAAGGQCALDASETGLRGLAGDLDRRLLADDPFEAMAEAHLRLADASRRPDTPLHQWLADQLPRHAIVGLVLVADPWCDQWQLQEQRLRHHAPVLAIDAGDSPARLRTRLEAFCEMLACHR